LIKTWSLFGEVVFQISNQQNLPSLSFRLLLWIPELVGFSAMPLASGYNGSTRPPRFSIQWLWQDKGFS
jgi:hypothetical protein